MDAFSIIITIICCFIFVIYFADLIKNLVNGLCDGFVWTIFDIIVSGCSLFFIFYNFYKAIIESLTTMV